MLDVKLDEYTGYNINIDANIDNYNYKTLTLLLGGDVYNKYIRRIDKSIEFLDFLESEPAKEIITTIREIIRDSNGNEVNIVVTSGQLELIKHELSKGRCKIEAKVKEYENKEKRQQLLNAIATNINSAFSNLIKLQDEFSPSGLKISIVAAPQRSRSGNPILRSSSRYLEIENIESLDVKIGKG